MAETLLVRYGELALKSPPVRRQFEDRLKHNLLSALGRAGMSALLRADRGHLYLEVADARAALPHVARVFGVVSVSPVVVLPADVESVAREVVERIVPGIPEGTRFAVRARRTGTHPFTSQQLAARVGEAVLEASPSRSLRVDLSHPQFEIELEVRANRTYLSTERFAGPGGLPLGVAGRVGAYVDGVRGALGAYLLMKRGCRASLVASAEGSPLVEATLRRFDPDLAPEGPLPPEDAWARLKERAVEEDLEGVALALSPAEMTSARAYFGELVLFSPTVGLSEKEVEERWSAVRALAG